MEGSAQRIRLFSCLYVDACDALFTVGSGAYSSVFGPNHARQSALHVKSGPVNVPNHEAAAEFRQLPKAAKLLHETHPLTTRNSSLLAWNAYESIRLALSTALF